jgi:hypothetical protein
MIDKVKIIKENFLAVLAKATFNNLSATDLININKQINNITKAIVDLEEVDKISIDKKNKLEKKDGKSV